MMQYCPRTSDYVNWLAQSKLSDFPVDAFRNYPGVWAK